MSCELQAAGTIELYFYGELPPAERADGPGAPRADVRSAAQALDDLSVIRAALAGRPDVATPPGGDWSGFMDRLERARSPHERSPVATDRRAGARDRDCPAAGSRRIWRCGRRAGARHRRRAARAAEAADAATPRDDVATSTGPARNRCRGAAGHAVDHGGRRSGADGGQRSALRALEAGGAGARPPRTGAPGDDWSYERELAVVAAERHAAVSAGRRGARHAAARRRHARSRAGAAADVDVGRAGPTASLEQLQRLIRRRDLLTKMDVRA